MALKLTFAQQTCVRAAGKAMQEWSNARAPPPARRARGGGRLRRNGQFRAAQGHAVEAAHCALPL